MGSSTRRTEEECDLLVIGAGIYGLPVAKTYLEVNPSARVLVLDAGDSIGGTWAAERVYDDLYSNNLVGTLEYSGFPMDAATFGVQPGSHVPGHVLNKYLNAYVDHYGLRSRIRLRATVKCAQLAEDATWLVQYEWKPEDGRAKDVQLVAKKLVLATGSTSQPHMPSLAGSEKFGGHLFHSKVLAKRIGEIEAAKNVVIYGGSKSAADVAYVAAVSGKHVDWVVRESGKGTSWLSQPYVSPAKLQMEKLATTRWMTFLAPTLDLDAYPTIRRFFHNTSIGRALLRLIFGIINSDVITGGRFNDHPETKKLIPANNIYWYGTAVGIFNYPKDFFDFVRQGLINVHVADIASLSHETVHLSTGVSIEADVLVCATGYETTPTLRFLPSSISDKIGISTAGPSDPTVRAADFEIMQRFPELKDQPSAGPAALREREQPSYKLYRGAIPPAFLASRNLAYCGVAISLRNFLLAQIHALWITAFLDGRLSAPLPGEAEAEWEATLQNRFWRWRAPNGLGPKLPDMAFELMPFMDTLLRDLGLDTRRKNSWWRELVEYYGVADYPDIVQEWLDKERGAEYRDGPDVMKDKLLN